MKTTTYQISERSTLHPGTAFRARGGPVFQLEDGTEVPVCAKGPFLFQCAEHKNGIVYLHAIDKSGNHAVLHVEGERNPPFPGLIPRPYQVKNRMRKGLAKLNSRRKVKK